MLKKIKFFLLTKIIFFLFSLSVFSSVPEDTISNNDLISLINKVPPPPKSINDVIKLLENSKSDVQVVEKYKQIANSKPDPNLKGAQLFEFHQRQFEALEQLGLVKELEQNCLRGIEIAKELYKELSSDAADQIYLSAETNCVNFHSVEGDRKKALERIEPLFKHPYVQRTAGWELTLLYFKIDNLTWLGDLNSAQEAVKDVDRLIGRMRGFRSWPDWGYHWTYNAELAKGNYYMLAGKPQEAELNFGRALNAMNTRIKYNQQAGNDPNAKVNQKEQMISYKAYCLALIGLSLQSQRKLVEAEYYLRESLKIYLSL